MKAFNVEIFTNTFEYKSSAQTEEVAYKYDYTDVEKNKIEINAKAEAGDYIVIYNDDLKIYGLVSGTEKGETTTVISYKPFNSYFDVDIFAFFHEGEKVEETLERLVRENYTDNDDEYQNIKGLDVITLTETPAEYGWTFADGKVNLFDVIQEAFTTYGIVCDFIIDRQEKEILLTIQKVEGGLFNIEPDLPNIIEKKIVIKEAKDTKNKVLFYNTENLSETAIYYKDADENITKNPLTRVLPVNFTTKEIKVSGKQTFEEKALAEAAKTLKATKYKNLMEFTVAEKDLLLRPLYRSVGQEAQVHIKDTVYKTVLTGYEYKENKAKLIFGTIRQELTKKLKRQWRES